MVYETEFKGTIIKLNNKATRCELIIDGKTMDFFEGFSAKNGEIVLYGKNADGDEITVKYEKKLIAVPYLVVYFNGRRIKDFLI